MIDELRAEAMEKSIARGGMNSLFVLIREGPPLASRLPENKRDRSSIVFSISSRPKGLRRCAVSAS
ncbi:MAG TPA: hypothetical protein VJZ76_14360 [Thermoanaerobaculia bacterium]|nr:hypothetical protein [Thermoanaerobaculia bacterium]